MVKHTYYLLSLIALLFLSSCGSYTNKTLFRGITDVDPETIKDVQVVNDQGQGDIYYRLKVNDVISIRNLQNMEFGTAGSELVSSGDAPSFEIDVTGAANLPTVGKVQLAGLTRREASIKLQEIYEAKSLLKPIIELKIVNVKVTMLGEFNAKGKFLLESDNIRLEDMIAQAGGLTKEADPRTVQIIRGNRKNPEIIRVNLTNIKSLASDKLILQNNDLITVAPTKNVMAAEKLQSYNNIIQPLLVIVNLAVLIFTFTR